MAKLKVVSKSNIVNILDGYRTRSLVEIQDLIKKAIEEFGSSDELTELYNRVTDLEELYDEDKPLSELLSEINTTITNSVSAAKDEIIGGANGSYDTLKKIQDILEDGTNGINALLALIASKVDQTEYDGKVNDIESRLDVIEGGDTIVGSIKYHVNELHQEILDSLSEELTPLEVTQILDSVFVD